ncbi:MAG: spermidine/putrescine ABC transporter substrate-binding protein [Candidatus Methylacidiphilales bacterium]|nr:spermidine/putrescine ABC transporter substrate-binding protein [Candidatus Methylacidiphilales bacterium]
MTTLRTLALLASLLITLGACGPQSAPTPTAPKVLNLFIWEEYLDPALKADFEKETGIKVVEANYGSNEDMLAKLQAGGGFDVVVPSDYMVQVMRRMNLLEKLDHSRLPHLANVDPFFRKFKYDPGYDHAIPFQWTATGFGYNSKSVKNPPASWSDVLDPVKARALKGRLSMLNDPREVIGGALIFLGFSPNTIRPEELAKAEAVLLAQKPLLAKYDNESFEDSLASGETLVAHGWAGEFATAQTDNPDLRFALPKEGAILSVDNLAIPVSSKNRDAAYLFIDYLLRAEIAVKVAEYSLYGSANAAALPQLAPELRNGIGFTRPEGFAFHQIEDLGENTALYDKIWSRLKSE